MLTSSISTQRSAFLRILTLEPSRLLGCLSRTLGGLLLWLFQSLLSRVYSSLRDVYRCSKGSSRYLGYDGGAGQNLENPHGGFRVSEGMLSWRRGVREATFASDWGVDRVMVILIPPGKRCPGRRRRAADTHEILRKIHWPSLGGHSKVSNSASRQRKRKR